MRTITSAVAGFAAALFMCGNNGTQAQTAVAKPAAQSRSGKTLCVASALGHKFRVQKVGIMLFGNSLDEVATGSWGIDDFVASRVQNILSGKFAVRRLPLSAQHLNALENGGVSAVSSPLSSAAGGAKCDTYLTITRAGAQIGGTNQRVGGLGILKQDSVLGDYVYVHAIFDLRTYDSNFTHLRTERASLTPMLLNGLTRPGIYGMVKSVDASWYPAAAQASVQSAQIKNTARALVGEGLAKELPGLFQ